MTPGKEGITAHVIKDSISEHGIRITTMELEYPRFIHSELMTHRMLSKNCASSRAIPIQKMNELIIENPAMPVFWGKNQAGMSAKEELTGEELQLAQWHWIRGSRAAVELSDTMHRVGMHKQLANRVTEAYQRMKTVITGTEWANILWLRDHEDAQPEFGELAKCIRAELNDSDPELLHVGQWHLPYVNDTKGMTIDNALKLSASCCAQVSYRKMDESLDKAIDIYDKLVGMDRKHASPFEHQAKVMEFIYEPGIYGWETGVTHIDRRGDCWSGNFRGWIQHRKLIEGEAVW